VTQQPDQSLARLVEEELKRCFDHAAEGMHWVGADGTILWANQTELDMLGYAPDDYIGHDIREFHVDPPVIADILERLGRGETLLGYDARVRHRDGSIRRVQINSNVRFEDGHFRHTRCFTRDVTERQQADEAAMRLASIVEHSADAIYSQDERGCVTSWNPAAERMFGHTADEMIGSSLRRIIPPELWDQDATILAGLFGGAGAVSYESVRLHKRGHTVDVALTASAIRNRAGQVVGVSKLARDITDRKRLEAQERAARREAEAANRAKDEFLAMLGHELRNPLSPILTAVQLMKLRGADSVERERIVIERQVSHLTRLVDDLLDVARIARGKVELKQDVIDIADVVGKAMEMVSPLFEERMHAVHAEVPRGLTVYGDPTRLGQVMANLLTNAAKYTNQGGRIEISGGRDGDQVVVRVKDNGLGIAPEMLSQVFELFVQQRQPLDRTQGGLDLGLTIVRSLVERHGGQVIARSEGLGQGAEFEVRLPAATVPVAATVARPSEAESIRPAANGARVLVVDDNVDAADLLVQALTAQGHVARAAYDAADALKAVAEFRPTVAFVDIGLPVMNGYELASHLRQTPGLAALRLVAVTGYGQQADRERALAAGFAAHLVKPVDLADITNLLADSQ
jgi:PAS domain S-box-containing protein